MRGRTGSLLGWAALAARLLVGGVWVWAGAIKFVDPLASVQAVKAYQIFGWQTAEWIGYTLPTVEIVVGAALIFGVFTRGAAVLSALLFAAFIAGIASVWIRGIEIDCGCFGGGGAKPGAASQYPWEIARDAVLLALSLLIAWFGAGRLAVSTWLFGRRDDDPVLDPDTPPETMTNATMEKKR